jgi:hypothetical protein
MALTGKSDRVGNLGQRQVGVDKQLPRSAHPPSQDKSMERHPRARTEGLSKMIFTETHGSAYFISG